MESAAGRKCMWWVGGGVQAGMAEGRKGGGSGGVRKKTWHQHTTQRSQLQAPITQKTDSCLHEIQT